jgi:DNA-binding NarL/FixJ family response regulator
MPAIRIVIADDHSLIRVGLKTLLRQIKGIDIVGEASDGIEAFSIIQDCHPDVALLDIKMPGVNGIQVASRIARSCPLVKVIMLAETVREEYIWYTIQAKATGYPIKDLDAQELNDAIQTVMSGDSYFARDIPQEVMNKYLHQKDREGSLLDHLSARQQDVLHFIATGLSTKKIAQVMQLSPKTVESHRSQLMKRLNIHDITGLVRYAIRVGLVEPDL